jgi:hypothetical protein
MGAMSSDRGFAPFKQASLALSECPESIGEEQLVESVVSVGGEFKQLLAGVSGGFCPHDGGHFVSRSLKGGDDHGRQVGELVAVLPACSCRGSIVGPLRRSR